MELAVLGFLAVISSILHQGITLSCYECNSHHNESCRENPPHSTRTVCKYDRPICRTLYMEVKKEIEGMTPHTRVVRTCGEMDERDVTRPCYRISEYGVNQLVCSCTEDNCNSSSITAVTRALLVLVVFVIVF
ncbi:uncharacterized protein LOC106138824 [Amyelois transitella]|uniref:uncharacterized protein LOC106138824 n=1 Tax=Amyelois transitella TaxID=680683 RepID=UPI00067ACDA2|nr:uncharacterized protein LOC106138824 [Amyelois transitella]